MESAYRRLIEHLQTWALGFPEALEIEALLRRRVSAPNPFHPVGAASPPNPPEFE